MDNKKSYYAIIPANVRYDESLPDGAKLLYGEITCLCNEKGFCWATNTYFAKLYKVSNKTISRWVGNLKEQGYIDVSMSPKSELTNEQERRLSIVQGYGQKCLGGIDKNVHTPLDKNVQGNNTSRNIKNNSSVSSDTTKPKKKFVPPTLEDVRAYILEKRLNVDAQKFFDYYDAGDWHDAKGKAVKNWKQKCLTWDRHDNQGKTEVKAKPIGNGVYRVSSFAGGEEVWKPTKIIR